MIMNQFTQKICALHGCDRPVTNWRSLCCCPTHQRKFAGQRRHGTENQPIKTKEDLAPYYRQHAIEKAKRVKSAVPAWADKEKIKEYYNEAVRLTIETGIRHEVDHIIPLTHKLVCGLHNEFNLQVISQTANRSKNNKFSI